MSERENTGQKKEQPSTYFVQDRQNEHELKRLTIQDHLVTTSMGGVLPEQTDPAAFRRVLDVGCGIGGWIIEAAQTYPEMSLIGVDISNRMIDYAREQARVQNVAARVEFLVMDALLMLEFPTGFFDLVNMRLGGSFLRTWEWPKLFSEALRVARSGGVIRFTETEVVHYSNSPAFMQFFEMFQCALYRSGHLFTEESGGIVKHLEQLFIQHGVQQVQTKAHSLQYHAGTAEGQAYIETSRNMFQAIRPFLQKWGCISKDYDAITQQALREMEQPDFHVTWNLLTAWGKKL